MASRSEFQPDWASAPGDTIADILRERKISLEAFAERLGQAVTDVNDLLAGRATITIGVARQLERVLGASIQFWMSRDFQYRDDSARLKTDEKDWLAQLPISDMIKFGWLRPVPRPSEEATACLRFFGVPDVRAWRNRYASVQAEVAFKTSPSFDSRPAAVAAWLRQGEVEAKAIQCAPWNPTRFRESLTKIRRLTRQKDPNVFVPALREECAANGVAVAIVRSPSGCRASGATWFVSEDKALLQLSFRYLRDDHFWFTFFHEAGHLLLHSKGILFLEGTDGIKETAEREANEFAAEVVIPSSLRESLLRLRANGREVIRFARQAGISPGLVVGQLQYFKRIKPNQLTSLTRRFDWNTLATISRESV